MTNQPAKSRSKTAKQPTPFWGRLWARVRRIPPIGYMLLVFVGLLIVAAATSNIRPPWVTSAIATEIATLARPSYPPIFPVPSMPVREIQAIRIQDQADTFVMARGGNGEWTTPNLSGPLDPTRAYQLALTISIMGYIQTIPNTNNPADFGFDLPLMQIQILKSDQTTHGILIGAVTADGAGVYALIDDRPDVYVLDRSPLEYLFAVLDQQPILAPTVPPQATVGP
jgi:hypothetical protein